MNCKSQNPPYGQTADTTCDADGVVTNGIADLCGNGEGGTCLYANAVYESHVNNSYEGVVCSSLGFEEESESGDQHLHEHLAFQELDVRRTADKGVEVFLRHGEIDVQPAQALSPDRSHEARGHLFVPMFGYTQSI